MKELDDLRAAVFAFLEIDAEGPDHEVIDAGYERVKAMLDAAQEAKPTQAEARALWSEIEKAARTCDLRYMSPLYPWGW